ncbi:hypothetical protein Tco_0936147 [Tanacetum coccineum]
MTPYTAYPNIQGIIYQDDMDRNYGLAFPKDMITNITSGGRVMINAIEQRNQNRRLMRSLEKFVGGRPYEGDMQLLERTI